jgi:hypothetical protein
VGAASEHIRVQCGARRCERLQRPPARGVLAGTGGAIQHAEHLATGWKLSALGGASKELAIGNNADGRIEIFYVGTNDQLFHRVQVTGGWSGELAFGTAVHDVSVGRNPDGRLELFYATSTGAPGHTAQVAPNGNGSARAALP